MTYREHILNLPAQFDYQPEIINKDKLRPFKHIIIAGMGGSRMAPDMLSMLHPELDIHVCSNDSLPALSTEYLSQAIIIANSHSGDTKETLSAAHEALQKGLNLAVVTQGGSLAAFAHEHALPHVITSATGGPARLSFGHSLKALMALLDIREVISLGDNDLEASGKNIAQTLEGGIPLIYAPQHLNSLGYIWKVILNETAKTPAFCNRYPELFHNELASFDSALSKQLRILVLQSGNSDQLLTFLKTKDIQAIPVQTSNIFSSITLAHWTALALSEITGVDPLATPVIDEFKKSL